MNETPLAALFDPQLVSGYVTLVIVWATTRARMMSFLRGLGALVAGWFGHILIGVSIGPAYFFSYWGAVGSGLLSAAILWAVFALGRAGKKYETQEGKSTETHISPLSNLHSPSDLTHGPKAEQGESREKVARANVGSQAVSELHEDLIKLDDLRKNGLINDAEFEAQKQRLLNKQ